MTWQARIDATLSAREASHSLRRRVGLHTRARRRAGASGRALP